MKIESSIRNSEYRIKNLKTFNQVAEAKQTLFFLRCGYLAMPVRQCDP